MEDASVVVMYLFRDAMAQMAELMKRRRRSVVVVSVGFKLPGFIWDADVIEGAIRAYVYKIDIMKKDATQVDVAAAGDRLTFTMGDSEGLLGEVRQLKVAKKAVARLGEMEVTKTKGGITVTIPAAA